MNGQIQGVRGAILPEICLYVCLRYLAGGSYSNIQVFTVVSKSLFYQVLWKTIHAINNTKESLLSIKFPVSKQQLKVSKAF
jgi:hypothetical protein